MEVPFSSFCLPVRAQGEKHEGQNVSPGTDTQTSYGDQRHPRQLSHRRSSEHFVLPAARQFSVSIHFPLNGNATSQREA